MKKNLDYKGIIIIKTYVRRRTNTHQTCKISAATIFTQSYIFKLQLEVINLYSFDHNYRYKIEKYNTQH